MEVELTVDGKNIEINHFVTEILAAMTGSSVETLHGVEEDWKEMTIKLKR
ncbi:hypothetical protein [Methanococcoides alaskense]|uniref:Uncharacterized protein n=1 Tax=Methanococcoides alaskense TaxID=325778 RepID=A0AA90TYM3_9EURY|nr:hypothetical protein [Methanococcoides alaskense]MCD4808076.1 hypothetical protein [Methanococcoides sp.]MDA0524118.1 hypothetical protein [Methanococcoides alaskense]MDR6222571.1 hypothetical protein [Methanococcoides alaskense]